MRLSAIGTKATRTRQVNLFPNAAHLRRDLTTQLFQTDQSQRSSFNSKDPKLRIYFVFVSSVTVKGFKQQEILKTDFLRDGSKVSALSIINEERIAELAARNIHTVSDLKKAVDTGEKGLSYYKRQLSGLVEMNEANLKLLDRFEQYLFST
jgi:hypothetical protein